MAQLELSAILVSRGASLIAAEMGGQAPAGGELLGAPETPAHLGPDEAVRIARPRGLM
jgi:hypothetical protein